MVYKKQFASFKEFYPYYLSEHRHPVCQLLHVTGSTIVLCLLVWILFFRDWSMLIYLPIIGYGLAWVGHFFFEKNRPATFTHPLYSFMGDWVMLKDFLLGRLTYEENKSN